MTVPRLSKTQSGYGGRGYVHPETGQRVPSVTTVLKAGAAPGITQWAVDQTAAYAVANVDDLMSRSEVQGWGFLRWYHKRDPLPLEEGVNLRNYHVGVLNDAAEMGTLMHEYIEADINPLAAWPDTSNVDDTHWQMVEQWEAYKSSHYFEAIETESTVWNESAGYAGTFDIRAWIDGQEWLLDVKTSRNVWPDHEMQMAALRAGTTYFPDAKLTGEWKGNKWIGEYEERDWQELMNNDVRFGLFHIRPDDVDSKGNFVPAYADLIELDTAKLDIRYKQFLGLLQVKKAEAEVKEWEKRDKSS